jgi:hypothetical protein
MNENHAPICQEPFAALQLLADGCDAAWTCICGKGWLTQVTGEREELERMIDDDRRNSWAAQAFGPATDPWVEAQHPFPWMRRFAGIAHEDRSCELCPDPIAEGASYFAAVEVGTSRIVAKAHVDCADVHGFEVASGQRKSRIKASVSSHRPSFMPF